MLPLPLVADVGLVRSKNGLRSRDAGDMGPFRATGPYWATTGTRALSRVALTALFWTTAIAEAASAQQDAQCFLEAADLVGRYVFQVDFDTDGGVWIASSNGLRHYDGYEWRSISTVHGLPSNFTRSVLVDSEHQRLWVGTDLGVTVLSLDTLQVERTLTTELAGSNVRRIRHGIDGAVWVGGDTWRVHDRPGGLTRFDGSLAAPRRYTTADGLPSAYIMDVYVDREDRTWAMTGNGLARLDGERFTTELCDMGPAVEDTFIWCMAETADGALLAAAQNALYRRDHGSWTRLVQWRTDNPQLVLSLRGEFILPDCARQRLLLLDPKALSRPDHSAESESVAFPFLRGRERLEDMRTAPDGSIWFVGRNLVTRWRQPRSGLVSEWASHERRTNHRFLVGGTEWETTPTGFARVHVGESRAPEAKPALPVPAPGGVMPFGRAIDDQGRTIIVTSQGAYRHTPGAVAWSPLLDTPCQAYGLVRTGDVLWFATQDAHRGSFRLHRLRGDECSSFPLEIRAVLRNARADEAIFRTPDGLCIVRPDTEPNLIRLPPHASATQAMRDDAGVLWIDLGNGWLSYRSDGTPPQTAIEGPGRAMAGDAYRVRIRAHEWFQADTSDNAYSVSTRIDGAAWSPFTPLQGDELLLEGLDAGRHRLEVRLRDEGFDVDPTPAAIEFEVLRPGIPKFTVVTVAALAVLLVGLWWRRTRRQQVRLDSFRRLLMTTGAGVLTVDRTGRILGANQEACNVLGIRDPDGAETLFERLGTDADCEPWWHSLTEHGSIEDIERDIRDANGAERTLVLSAVENALPRDNSDSFRVLVRDVTASREIERQLRQAQKMETVGRLAGGIAHDFNNLLCGILGNADLIQMLAARGMDAEQVQQCAKNILSTGDSARQLTRQLLAFSRGGTLVRVASEVSELFQEVTLLLGHTIDPRIRIATGEIAPHSVVRGDRAQIHSAILNLALNARDAMPDGGTLTMSTATVHLTGEEPGIVGPGFEPGEFLRISVTDTGSGIPAADRNRIFEPFFTTKSPSHGTGLGLASVYGTVAAHRGTLAVESQVGTGTTIHMHFPATFEKPAPPPGEPVVTLPTPAATLLLVEDEPSVCQVAKQILTKAGHQVLVANDGKAAVAMFERHRDDIDLILMDMIMPAMNGAEAMAAIREIAPEARFLVTTGFATVEADELRSSGALAVLQKPYSNAELTASVQSALARIRHRGDPGSRPAAELRARV